MTTYRAAPHMTTFRCLGSECEDTCCRAWEIPISDDDVARLTTAIGEAGADDMINRIPNGRGGTVVVLRKLPNGACTQLDENQLCSLHARLGETVLPSICHSYPRAVGRVGETIELTGRLSCPEVARQCLLSDEAPMVESPIEPFGRIKIRLEVEPDGEVPYLTSFPLVRDALVELSTSPGFSVASRLYFIAVLADRIGAFYRRDATQHEPERLVQELAEIKRPEVQAELHAKRGASSPMDGLALQLAQGLMYSRLDAAPAFARVAMLAARTHTEAAGLGGIGGGGDMLKVLSKIPPDVLWRSHMERRVHLGPAQTARVDQYLERYCRSYWLQDWYPQSPTVLEHTMLLLLRVTLIKFLLIAHPALGPDTDAATTDRIAVDVVYAVSRAYDHNPSIREGLANMLTKQGMLSVDHAAALLKL